MQGYTQIEDNLDNDGNNHEYDDDCRDNDEDNRYDDGNKHVDDDDNRDDGDDNRYDDDDNLGDDGNNHEDDDDIRDATWTSTRVRGMVTRQRQRSDTARLAMNTFLKETTNINRDVNQPISGWFTQEQMLITIKLFCKNNK